MARNAQEVCGCLHPCRCLVHGDLHTGAVSDTGALGAWAATEPGCAPVGLGDGDAHLGHDLGCPAVDLGIFFAHLLLAAIDRGLQAARLVARGGL
jgi:hypothetical protein